jgi:hypothetical protein
MLAQAKAGRLKSKRRQVAATPSSQKDVGDALVASGEMFFRQF